MGDALRSPLRRRLLAAGALAAAAGLTPLGRALAHADRRGAPVDGYGPLAPVRDLATGLPLLELPAGFSYRTFGWAGEPLPGDVATPSKHDGMGVVAVDGDIVTLVRNHEVGRGRPFAAAGATFDRNAGGGTVTLRFDTRRGVPVDARASLSGTIHNCAGGVTPWGTWLSCEETVSATGGFSLKDLVRPLGKPHGWVFEVPARGDASAEPLTALGCFKHEAATVDPLDGIVYLTEDQKPHAGFYRFVPATRGDLRRGRLQMLRAAGAPDLRRGRREGERLRVAWVDIDAPERGIDAGGGGFGVLEQGLAGGASVFVRLEGCIVDGDRVWFTSTSGGDARCGQLWCLHPRTQELELFFESPSRDALDYPDNLVASPRGGLVICEDAEHAHPQRLWGMTAAGGLFTFCRSAVRLDGFRGFTGDFRAEEWAGTCFSPDGRWLFANLYRPGFSVAITGPWRDGLI